MKTPVVLEGFEGQTIEVQSPGFFSGPKLLVNGRPAAKGPKRNQMLVKRNDGTDVIASWKSQVFDTPQLVVDGKTIQVVRPLKWYEWIVSALPILLVFIGGALGAIIGLIAFGINTQIIRTYSSGPLKYFLVILISGLAVIAYMILAVILLALIQG